jgi:peptidoglycan/LPS O-acetylase OafA/YrhL
MARTARWSTLSASWRESQEPVLRTGRGQGRGPFGSFRIFGTIGSESGPNRYDRAFAGAVIRFLRFLVIINTLTLLAVWPGLPGVFEPEWWVFYGLLQTYSRAWIFKGLTPAWSLSVEAAFYIMLPFLALALARAGRRLDLRGRLRLQLVTLAICGAFGLGYRAFTFHQRSLVLLGTTLPAFLLWFAVGMSVAVVSAWHEGRELEWWPTRWLATHSGWCWALAAGVLVGMSLSNTFPRPFSEQPDTMASYLGEHILYALIALLVMLPAVFGEREGGLPRRLMGTRALRWLGRISYGLFLWNHPLLLAFQLRGWSKLIPNMPFLSLTLLGMPVVIACAWVSWWLVEQPALRLAHARRSKRGPASSLAS